MKRIEEEQNPKLRQKRKEKEEGLKPKARAECPCKSKVFLVLEDEDQNYHCHKYVKNAATGNFFFSKEKEETEIDKVFEWLTNTSQSI